MLIYLLLLILISNAIATNYNKSVLYSRFVILGLSSISIIICSNTYMISLEKSIGLYNGLFNVGILSQSFNLFIVILSVIISILTSFYPRKTYTLDPVNMSSSLNNENIGTHTNVDNMTNSSKLYTENQTDTNINNHSYTTLFLNKNGFQFTIIEYSLITLFILSGAILLISVGDLVSLFLSIELQSYGLYILATIYRNSESATGSGLTYFLLGGLSSCFILLGSAILYVNSGITNLDNIYILNSINGTIDYNGNHISTLGILSGNYYEYQSYFSQVGTLNYINFSLIILTIGLLFKISAAPFHFWSPDVYDGIPTIVTTFVAIIAKISLLILMLELVLYSDINIDNIWDNTEFNLNNTRFLNYEWKNILILSSLLSLFIGSLLGLTQYRIKRLFAYSTISHVGFILLALGINKIESIQAYIFYILQYSVSNLNAFFILITIGYTLYQYKYNSTEFKVMNKGISPNKLNDSGNNVNMGSLAFNHKLIDIENSPVQLLSQIKGYFYINSFLSISFAITLFSFVGIPPLIGFFAKQMVLSAALDEGYVFMTLIAVITSVIGAVYYLNIVKLIFFNKSDYIALENKLHDVIKTETNTNNISPSTINNVGLISINDKLSITISVLTILILFFIFMPDEWFRVVNILSLSINKY